MINRLMKWLKPQNKPGTISYQNGTVAFANITFKGVVVIIKDGYVEIREQGYWRQEENSMLQQVQVGGKNNIQTIN